MGKSKNLADLGSHDVLDTHSTGVDVTGTVTADTVGIGTSLPNTALTIINNNPYQLRLATTDNAYSSAGIFLGEDVSDPSYYGTINWDQSATSMRISMRDGSNAGGLIFETGNSSSVPTERMRIDSSGRVTMPYQPGFMARKSGFVQHPWSATTSWTSLSTGNHAGFNSSTGAFTAPVTGLYLIYLTLRSTDNTGHAGVPGMQFWRNGSAWESTDLWGGYAQSYSATYRPSFSATVNMYLSTNDYVQVGIVGDIQNAYFGGHLLG